jgi:hypothetical protein
MHACALCSFIVLVPPQVTDRWLASWFTAQIADNIENSVQLTRAGVRELESAKEHQETAQSTTTGALAAIASAAVIGGGILAGALLLA